MRTQRWRRLWATRRPFVGVVLMLWLASVGHAQASTPDQAQDPEQKVLDLLAKGEVQASRDLQEELLTRRRRDLGEDHPDSLKALSSFVETLVDLGELKAARQHAERAEAIHSRLFGESHPDTLVARRNLASIMSSMGELEAARGRIETVLQEQEQLLGPDHLDALRTRQELAITLYGLGELATSRQLLVETVAARSRIQGVEHPDTLTARSNLAVTLYVLGEIVDARRVLEDLAVSQERLWGPDHLDTLETRNNLGALLYEQSDLERARTLWEDVIAGYERSLGPLHPLSIPSRVNLGITLLRQGEPGSVIRPVFEAALLAQTQTLGENHPESLKTRHSLAVTYVLEGDLDSGRSILEKILEVSSESLGWEHPTTLEFASGLSTVLRDLGEPAAAAKLVERVLKSRERILGPNHPDTAGSLFILASLQVKLGDTTSAEALLQRTLAINRLVAPNSFDEADSLAQLGRLYQDTGRLELATAHYSRAFEAVEQQTQGFHRKDLQDASRRSYAEIYRRAIDVAVELERPSEALAILERSRARRFLDLLRERDLVFSDVPKELDAIRRNLAVLYDRGFGQLGSIREADHPQAFRDQLDRLRQLRRESEENYAAIRRAAPRVASLNSPRTLTTSQARDALDPGTAWLSYSVADTSTLIFLVTRDGVTESARLTWSRQILEERIELLHQLLPSAIPGTAVGDYDFERLQMLLRQLYGALIAPFGPQLNLAQRLLISPDGPLYRLPFAALLQPVPAEIDAASERTERERYLIEGKPIHTVHSATVYGELLSRRRKAGPSPTRLVAFGDPVYPERKRLDLGPSRADASRSEPNKAELVGLPPRGKAIGDRRSYFDWTPLPQSRREVESLADLYPDAQIFLGKEATEEQAKAIGRAAWDAAPRILHFATHGFLDDRLPMSSFLALSIPEIASEKGDNGLLQVWEIFEGLRLEADLVVLSACRSGLNPGSEGDGLIGLSRAFQYAGARSVAASLWNVADEATAELMVRFHRHLQNGQSHDEALRRAQMELLRGPAAANQNGGQPTSSNLSAPFFWAAFQIIGDWR